VGGRLHLPGPSRRRRSHPQSDRLQHPFRRRELVALGSFATRFGKCGNALETCDETELSLRLERAHGPGRIRYVPAARVQHFVPAARISWRLLVRRSLSEGLAKGRLQRLYQQPALGPERSYARGLVVEAVPRLVLEGIRRRDRSLVMGAAAILLSLGITGAAFVAGVVRESSARPAHPADPSTPCEAGRDPPKSSHPPRVPAFQRVMGGFEMNPTPPKDRRVARSPLPTRRLGHRLLEHVRIPLHRDGYALVVNSAFTAVTGLLYWILAARTYSAYAVGRNSALISSMMFLAGIASLNLPSILVRFLPESGRRTRRRVTWSYAVAASVALGAAAVFLVGVGAWAPRLGFLRSDGGLQVWFLVSTLAWCLFVIQDSVLTALGRAVWVPVENAVFSLLKLALLAALAAVVPVYGIFVSWTIAMIVSVVGVNVVIFARLVGPASREVGEAVLNFRDRAFARYFAADYMCSVALLSTSDLMPVIVTAVAGATMNAYYALAYAVALPLYALAENIGTSLMLHGAQNRAELPALTHKAAVQGLRLLVPAVALLVVLAPYLLSFFGPDYARESTTVFRLLALGALPNFVLALAISVARVRRRLRRAVVAVGTEAVLLLGLVTPLLLTFGVSGVGVAWVGSQCVVATGLLLTWRSSVDPEPADTASTHPGGAR
jgi:O-antigen/teichoic acid export membrane protein